MNGQIQSHQKHIPMRTCVVCRKQSPKRELTRVVMTSDGVQLDRTGKMNGRGAYLCKQESCWQRAYQTDVLSKALNMPLTNDDRMRLNRFGTAT